MSITGTRQGHETRTDAIVHDHLMSQWEAYYCYTQAERDAIDAERWVPVPETMWLYMKARRGELAL